MSGPKAAGLLCVWGGVGWSGEGLVRIDEQKRRDKREREGGRDAGKFEAEDVGMDAAGLLCVWGGVGRGL